MDSRFPAYLRWFVKKLDFMALPNLGRFIVAAAVIAFVAKNILHVPMDRFIFDPQAVLDGELWRLIVFPSQGITDLIWLFFFVLYIFFVFDAIEGHWGPGPTTVFTLFSYIMAITGAFVVGEPTPIWLYVVENISLAFGTLFPDLELYIYFVLPVKAKWLALLAGALLLFQFVMAGVPGKIMYVMVMSPYLIFFSPFLFSKIRNRSRSRDFYKKLDPKDWR
ncbi:MAG: hypothetical protein HYR96_10620 [Deltaproteobacteria bacterium]|nr:hypothetical protein [Deltaproteobacteria bacterium]MBI3294895.1 hypothetical protein [Deltaproteobacteria bacterium]